MVVEEAVLITTVYTEQLRYTEGKSAAVWKQKMYYDIVVALKGNVLESDFLGRTLRTTEFPEGSINIYFEASKPH